MPPNVETMSIENNQRTTESRSYLVKNAKAYVWIFGTQLKILIVSYLQLILQNGWSKQTCLCSLGNEKINSALIGLIKQVHSHVARPVYFCEFCGQRESGVPAFSFYPPNGVNRTVTMT